MAKGTKNDGHKLSYSLVPPITLRRMVEVFNYGAAKYGRDNWRSPDGVLCQERLYDAAMRHMEAWRTGELNDKESGLPHLAHAAVSLMMAQHNGGDRDVG